MLKKLLIAAAGGAFIALGVGEAVKAVTLELLASGLDSPRGLAFGPDGALYVTEAGRGGTGGCIPSPAVEGANTCYGPTGAITRIQNDTSERVVTGLPSQALPNGSLAFGPQDIAFDSTGNPFVIVGYASDPNLRDSVVGVPDLGQLITIDDFDGGGSWTRLADLAEYERLNNPDGTDFTSNPYALLIQGDTAFAVDAGANTLYRVGTEGSGLAVQSVFRERSVTDPLSGENVLMQPVPTSIAMGPDGALYVGELTGDPYPVGGARIYRIEPGNEPEVYADGFTNIIDLAFDTEGSLYVLEVAANSLASADPTGPLPTGALIQVAPDGNRTTITSGNELIFPTGLTFGPDGAIYVSNNAFNPGEGQVVRIDNTTPVPEPTSTLGLLAIGALFMFSQLKHNQKQTLSR